MAYLSHVDQLINRKEPVLQALIVCPNETLAADLKSAIEAVDGISVEQTLGNYPTSGELIHAARARSSQVVFLSFESVEEATQAVQALESGAPGTAVVGIHTQSNPKAIREAMRMGVRDFLVPPFEHSALNATVESLRQLAARTSPRLEAAPQVLTFLPAKAGVGASTVALNASAALARRAKDQVLLADFDLACGMLRFLLKLGNEYSVADAVEHGPAMEDGLWQTLVTKTNALDVLHAGRINPHLHIPDTQIHTLLEFLRSRYRVMSFDLSSNLERYALALMQASTRIVLVCTPELPSLHLAAEKLSFLRTLDLESRVAVVLNRFTRLATLTKRQVEDFLGVPVVQQLPNDYAGVSEATSAGSTVDEASPLGKSFCELAAKLADPHRLEGARPGFHEIGSSPKDLPTSPAVKQSGGAGPSSSLFQVA